MRVNNVAICATCGNGFVKRSPSHRYCEHCSTARDVDRKRLWAANNPISAEKHVAKSHQRSQKARAFGEQKSAEHREPISWNATAEIELDWYVRVSVPFDYAFSKNHLFALRKEGHVALRRESRNVRDTLRDEVFYALQNTNITPVPSKIWIDVLVQKSNHRGDAVNVIDLVCDALKEAVQVDDRWFSIRRVDWQIVKHNPRIYVGVGQEDRTPKQCCSYCGRILPYSAFNSKVSNANGIDRVCRECNSEGRRA